MKVVSCLTSLTRQSGGLFSSVKDITKHVNNIKGVTNTVIGPNNNNCNSDIETWRPLKTLTVPITSNLFGFQYCRDLVSTIKTESPDLIHAHGLWQYQSLAISRINKFSEVPYIVSPHGMLDDWAVNYHKFRKIVALQLYELSFLKSASAIRALCVSEAEAIRKIGIKNPIFIIPNGINLEFERAPQNVNKIKNINKKLLFLGRIHQKKGIFDLINAWTHLKPLRWDLIIAGWGDEKTEKELRLLIQKSGMGSNIEFVGPAYDEAKEKLFRECDAFILPSYSEGMPMAVLEAMAYSKLVLITPQCNIPEAIISGAALEITAGVEGLLADLPNLFGLPETARETAGAKGKKLVEYNFSWPKIAADLFAGYQWILGKQPKPDFVFS